MKSWLIGGLAIVNVLLFITWITRTAPQSAAIAQASRPGDYVMIPGEVIGGGGTSVVYLVDTTNGTLAAVAYDNNDLLAMPPIDLSRVFQEGDRGGRR